MSGGGGQTNFRQLGGPPVPPPGKKPENWLKILSMSEILKLNQTGFLKLYKNLRERWLSMYANYTLAIHTCIQTYSH